MPEITKKDALRWLEMQRDAINTEIAYAAPSDKAQYFGNLRAVNWLVDRVKDMTAVEYLEVCGKICEGREICNGCTLDDNCPFCTTQDNPRRAVEIVKQWKEEQDGH
jgi:hypothetical protein